MPPQQPAPRDRGSPRPERSGVQVLFVSDRHAGDDLLLDAFPVIRMPFDRAEAQAAAGGYDVIVVDARDEVRLSEVASLALGGVRGVVVLGPPNDPAEAMRYLDLGASDYISSRAMPTEAAARLKAVARSVVPETDNDLITAGDVTISLRRRQVKRRGDVVHLTPNEFAVLEVLAEEPGSLVTHHEIMTRVWGSEHAGSRHYLRLYIRQLREKLEDDPALPQTLLTEWGIGYRLDANRRHSTVNGQHSASA